MRACYDLAALIMLDLRPFLGIALAAALVSCADGSTQFEAKYAPGFEGGPRKLSVFGVFQDGRMSPEAWMEIGARLSPALGAKMCEVAYDDKLRAADPERFMDLDKVTQSEGITEDLLDRFVPAAQGDSIAVVSLHIKSAGKRMDNYDSTGILGSGRAPLPGGRYRAPNTGPRSIAGTTWQLGEIRLIATVFSTKTHTSEARIAMTYTGNNLDEAISKFIARLKETFPGSSCAGWSWDAPK